MGALGNDSSIEGDVYVQRLASYIRRNEEALANGLLCFSKIRSLSKVKPLRPSFTMHHLYYVTERIANSPLDVDVGPLNVKLDTPNHEPAFISFMANNARNQRNFDSDARSITSINSVKSIVSSASVYWMSFSFSRDPKVIQKDVKYLYSSFTKIPCLVLSPHTKINSIAGYEEYPCDTSVPLRMFKNLQVLELVEYEPNEVFGWHTLSEKLRILIIRKTKLSDLCDVLFSLVFDDENGRSSFSNRRQPKRSSDFDSYDQWGFLKPRHERTMSSSVLPTTHRDFPSERFYSRDNDVPLERSHDSLPDNKWLFLKQLTVTESSITSISRQAFKPLSNLVKLNLSCNLLEDLPDGLEQLVHIKCLNFADNYITNLDKLPKNLKFLNTINLNNNKITDILGLTDTPFIQKIDLRRNKLKEISLLYPLVKLAAVHKSALSAVYLSSNLLPKNYRVDLFNLFNGAKPKNSIKIDDSRPGYFESAMLLDPESAVKYYEKVIKSLSEVKLNDVSTVSGDSTPEVDSTFIGSNTPLQGQRPHKQSKPKPLILRDSALLNTDSSNGIDPAMASLSIQPETPGHVIRQTIRVLQNSRSAASLSGSQRSPVVEGGNSSPLNRTPSKSTMPLLPNQNLSNQPKYTLGKFPSMTRQYLSPMIHVSGNGSESTLRSSTTMSRLDIDTASLAPNVVTPVQVQVESFQYAAEPRVS